MTKHVVITGANRGIGLEFCRQYTALGYQVTAVVRRSSAELDALNVDVIDNIDVSLEQDVVRLAELLASKAIDILINNAGIFSNESLTDMDFSRVEAQIAVNAVAPLRVTHALQPQLSNGSKVAMITSRMGSIEDNGSGAYIGYRMSKAALNAAGVSLAHELKPKGVAVALLHPGFVQTQMVNFAGDISAQESAQRLISRIDELNLSNTGSFWHSNGELLPW
ncbi:SDR family oxidoreductase [Pseudoalteromonas luteoviolacea]|uniref:Short-chain dehydrogenase n=1 Tax=Pseudoalteromonas luteoviolacea S4054 TaxID=1129367 RepID=A0A0F6AAL5_9GAMM|nr:SDR family oxidoreductase [Pseudoalteromonas luteoviolacea]AOT06492.1 short-chain dehydrogenase [Pseudoalteromonas luteoviolacea]AOT11409.1 short-chain dehydrogenase [Pseudoalteromonas luteoviolacea]AOT16322.1 short-chain dehydrogenase [Pseudoalteromonas luteoviolacea]KKE83230.1 short-chain dehydrogenase [Pseudoalteromonas luteoviolacea S4054]KZN71161.1 short-chain dehydrogenase [Pseudoalteromonas luteoviolacea S4047-1]